jgi:hypothetical protein
MLCCEARNTVLRGSGVHVDEWARSHKHKPANPTLATAVAKKANKDDLHAMIDIRPFLSSKDRP